MKTSFSSEKVTAVQQAFAAWTLTVARHARSVIVICGILTVAAAWFAAGNLAIDTSTTNMISAETPFRQNAIAYDRAFPQFSDLIVIVVDAPSSDAATAMAKALTGALRGKGDLFKGIEYPEGDPFFRRAGLLYLDLESLSALADRLAAAEPFLATLAHQPNLNGLFDFLGLALRNDGAAGGAELADLFRRVDGIVDAHVADRPAMLAWRDLIDGERKDGARQIVLARPRLEHGGLSPGADALAAIRQAAADLRDDGLRDVTVRLTGSVAIADDELRSVALGGEKAGLLTLGLVVLLVVIGLRTIRLIVPAIATLVVGLIWTAAFAALAVGHLNLISIAFAVLFIGLGVDFSIHYCLYYRERAARDATGALVATGCGVGGSLAIGALCAAAGFLSFLPTDYKGLAELGLISGGGMAIAFFLNMTLLPAILSLFPGKPIETAAPGVPTEPFTGKYHRPILWIAAACAILAASAMPFAKFDFNPMNLKDPTSESVSTFLDLANDPRNGVYAIDVLVAGLDHAAREAERLSALPGVGTAVTLNSLVPEDQAEKLTVIDDMAYFLGPVLTAPAADQPAAGSFAESLEDFRRTAATFLAGDPGGPLADAVAQLDRALSSVDPANAARLQDLDRRLTGYLPGLLDDLRLALEAGPVSVDDIPPHIRRNWLTNDGVARIQLQPAKPVRSNDELRQFAATVLAAAPNAVGTPVTISEAGDAVVSAFREASIIAFVLVSAILIVLLRGIARSFLVLLPLSLAAVLTGGTSVALNLPFNFANIIVLPLLFGLGVASGVHMVMREQAANRAIDIMQTSTPRAVLFSALTTIASFGSLALSGHLGMTSMGQLLTIAIGYTLVCMLLVLPAMMAWRDRRSP
ncbi:MAG: MMPL family transporter [Alphaproteobacteria bacterium]